MKGKLIIFKDTILFLIYQIYKLLPLQEKVSATAVEGTRYADNPKYIVENILTNFPMIKVDWLYNPQFPVNVPKRIKLVNNKNIFQLMYSLATSKVLITSSSFPLFLRKRKGQVIINTWHGGLGIKILGSVQMTDYGRRVRKHNSEITDVFISNSNHLSTLYREVFHYKGPIWKCGYPKSDILFSDKAKIRRKIRLNLGVSEDTGLLLYAPTFRDWDKSMRFYDIDYKRIIEALEKKYHKKYYFLVKYHPNMHKIGIKLNTQLSYVVDLTSYDDMQELTMACDILVSDYSSCLFDAALAGLECHIFANDPDEYASKRGVYYTMEELPFTGGKSNDELIEAIEAFDYNAQNQKWQLFVAKTGLEEKGNASYLIAKSINDYISDGRKGWSNTDL